jgi:hypothetical protein
LRVQLDEETGDCRVSLLQCEVEGRLPLAVLQVHIRVVGQQPLHQRLQVVQRRVVQGTAPAAVPLIHHTTETEAADAQGREEGV